MPMEDPMDPALVEPVRITGVATKPLDIRYVTGIDPTGATHKINKANARDWQLRPGHQIIGPWRDAKAEVSNADEEDAPAPEQPGVVVSDPKPAAEVLEPLEELRREAEALGIKVHPQWGKKRLTTEIKQAKDGQS